MARKPRIDFPGAVHHVYARGIEKRRIFHDDKDRLVFLERIRSNVDKWEVSCFSWALMENHFHLLIRSNKGNLPSFMRCLMTAFSMHINERHERVGHLFQNRYMSKVISEESYLREAIRYIHLNPIRAGIINCLEDLDVYPWSGHSQIMETSDAGWMDIFAIRELFDAIGNEWKTSYREFIKAGFAVADGDPQKIDDSINLNEMKNSAFKSPNIGKPPKMFFDILAYVSGQTGVPMDRIMSKNRSHCEVDARRAVLVSCMESLDTSAAKVSRWLGISEACAQYLLRTKMKLWKNV